MPMHFMFLIFYAVLTSGGKTCFLLLSVFRSRAFRLTLDSHSSKACTSFSFLSRRCNFCWSSSVGAREPKFLGSVAYFCWGRFSGNDDPTTSRLAVMPSALGRSSQFSDFMAWTLGSLGMSGVITGCCVNWLVVIFACRS